MSFKKICLNMVSFKILFFGISLILIGCGSGKINKNAADHARFIADSKLNNNVIVSMDTVYFKGEPYCILKETGISFSPFYGFYTLSGEKVIDVLPYSAGDGKATTHHEYTFYGTSKGSKAYMDYSFSTISVCEDVINNNLMNTNELRPIDVGNFCKKHPRPPKFNPSNLKVRREMSVAIKINQGYGEIRQGDVMIGKFTQGTDKPLTESGTNSVFKINFMNGTQCAVVTFPWDKNERKSSKYLEVFSEFDAQVHRLTLEPGNTTFDIDAFKQAVEYLVQKGYL